MIYDKIEITEITYSYEIIRELESLKGTKVKCKYNSNDFEYYFETDVYLGIDKLKIKCIDKIENERKDMIYDKEYWDNKYEKKSIVYGCRCLRGSDAPVEIDVRNFICAKDSILQKYIEQYDLKKETHNETALAIQKFIVDNFEYISDTRQDGVNEYWQFPYESIASFKGDCEDGAILMASLMINAGIPSYRVKCVAGYVRPSDTAPTSGHAFCIYLAEREESNQEWVVLDWCYYPDTELKCEDKPLLKDGGYNGCYKDIWWTFNNETAWSNKEVVIDTTRVGSEAL